LQRIGYTPKDITGARFRKAVGCANCQYSGYKGRVGIFELLIMDELVRDAILARRTSKALRQVSIESTGLLTLLEDGVVKAVDGITALDELLRSLPRLQNPRPISQLRRLIGDSL
jgi:type IV pilus assembly protein PilB